MQWDEMALAAKSIHATSARESLPDRTKAACHVLSADIFSGKKRHWLHSSCMQVQHNLKVELVDHHDPSSEGQLNILGICR
jgi:hypothetical protein